MPPEIWDRHQQMNTRDRGAPGFAILLVWAMLPLALGAWLFVIFVLSHLLHWPRDYSVPVRAQVVESRMMADSGWFFFDADRVFIYRYIYQGELFRSSAYRPGGHLDEAIRAYPAGSMLTAYVDPDAPGYSMVWPSVARDQLADLVLGLALLVIGAGWLYWRVPPRVDNARL